MCNIDHTTQIEVGVQRVNARGVWPRIDDNSHLILCGELRVVASQAQHIRAGRAKYGLAYWIVGSSEVNRTWTGNLSP